MNIKSKLVEEGQVIKNKLGEELLSDGEVLDLVYAWLAMEGTIPELRQLLHDNEPEEKSNEKQI